MSQTVEKQFLNINDVHVLTGYTKGTLYQKVFHKQIPHFHLAGGRYLRFKRDEIIKWMVGE